MVDIAKEVSGMIDEYFKLQRKYLDLIARVVGEQVGGSDLMFEFMKALKELDAGFDEDRFMRAVRHHSGVGVVENFAY